MVNQGASCRNRASGNVSEAIFARKQDKALVILLDALQPQVQALHQFFVHGDGVQAEDDGAVAVSAGSSLTAPAKTGDFEKIIENAREFVEEVKKARAQYCK